LERYDQAKQYLALRSFNDPELLKIFKIGLCDRSLGHNLPHMNLSHGKRVRSELQALSIYRKSGHEHLRNCLTFPIYDENGNIVEMYGRKFVEIHDNNIPTHLYLPGPHKGIFNIRAVKQHDEIILTEAIIDALSFWVHGFKNVTA